MQTHHNPHAIPFGWNKQAQRMSTVTEAKNGLSCGCTCVACGAPLLAKQGQVRSWHFAHAVETQCKTAAEAAIHQMAKQLVAEKGQIYFPARQLERTVHGAHGVWSETIHTVVQAKGLFLLENCQVEKTVFTGTSEQRSLRLDVLATHDGMPIAIEIFNTHAVSSEKAALLESSGISVLEIQVSDILAIEPVAMLAALESRLFGQSEDITWLAHVGDFQARRRLDEIEERVRTRLKHRETRLLRARESREKFRESPYSSIKVDGGVIYITNNHVKVCLKANGQLEPRLFRQICGIAHDLQGQFNRRYRKWEFTGHADQAIFLHELQDRIDRAIGANGLVSVAAFSRSTPSGQVEYRQNSAGTTVFDDPAMQEDYEERAAILEFDANHGREQAEQKAFFLIRNGHQAC